MDLELFKKLTKYPFIYNSDFYNANELNQNKSCVKCDKKDCLNFYSNGTSLEKYICTQGYDNFLLHAGGNAFLFNGLIFSNNTRIPKGRREVRLNWVAKEEELTQFISKIIEVENYISHKIDSAKENNFSMFHDFKTTMNIVFTCTQDVIHSLQGKNFNEKLENSSTAIKDLYSSLSLITSQLGMMDVIVNPTSVTFGNKREINLFKLFHKMSILFGHVSNKQRISINLMPSKYIVPDCLCFESIEFIPLILIDNAIKYSIEKTTIEISINKVANNKVHVKVDNWGPVVSDIDATKIFDKFYRADNALSHSKEGVGVGLWVAQKILESHNSKLIYTSSFPYEENGRTLGLNTFEFHFPLNSD